MNNIIFKQNEDYAIKLLKAQRVAYDEAKNYQIIDTIVAIMAVISPVIFLLLEDEKSKNIANNIFAILSLILTILMIITEIFRKSATKLGAIIQEEFDVFIFDLKWNHILIKTKANVDKVTTLSKRFIENEADLKDWYLKEVNQNINYGLAVLLHYKTNIIWGKYLRNKYCRIIIILAILYYSIIFLVGYKMATFQFYVWLAPSLPLLVYCTNIVKNQMEFINNYNDIDVKIDKWFDDYKKKKSIVPSKEELRQFQDLFYIQRLNPYKVPNWFYRLHKNDINDIAKESINTIIQNKIS